ncbi:MAG: cytidine deaminase [Verrucomicrobia bacterium]|nr:cytidine deaminase [Verrucomicrobiota bacterium]
MEVSLDSKALLNAAVGASDRAYAPYSKFKVGAAVLAKSGKIYTGCNVENASYGLTVCAERVAVFKAISEGDKELEALALSAEGGAYPCGACRQVLQEFNPNLRIFLGDSEGQLVAESSLKDLLPKPFGPECLENK